MRKPVRRGITSRVKFTRAITTRAKLIVAYTQAGAQVKRLCVSSCRPNRSSFFDRRIIDKSHLFYSLFILHEWKYSATRQVRARDFFIYVTRLCCRILTDVFPNVNFHKIYKPIPQRSYCADKDLFAQ